MRSTRQRCDRNAVFRQVTWNSVFQATKREHAHLVFDYGRDVEPVELISHEIADVIKPLPLRYIFHSCSVFDSFDPQLFERHFVSKTSRLQLR